MAYAIALAVRNPEALSYFIRPLAGESAETGVQIFADTRSRMEPVPHTERRSGCANPIARIADHDGGTEVEASLGLDGLSVAVSKTLHAPAWLQIWWIGQTPFGGLLKTFRRM
jgi:hypothetical protein